MENNQSTVIVANVSMVKNRTLVDYEKLLKDKIVPVTSKLKYRCLTDYTTIRPDLVIGVASNFKQTDDSIVADIAVEKGSIYGRKFCDLVLEDKTNPKFTVRGFTDTDTGEIKQLITFDWYM